MERVNLTKYGFIRCPEADFADDGNRFTCYKVGRVRVSKLVFQGELYLAGRIKDGNKLSYKEYSSLPHYKSMDRLNGVTLSQITENDIQKFYEDCQTYNLEYDRAEANTIMPTYKEILGAYRKIRRVRINEYEDILLQVTVPMVLTLRDYDLKQFQNYFTTLKSKAELNIEEVAERTVGTSYSKSIIDAKSIENDCKSSFYYNELLKLIDKIGGK